MVWVVRYDDTSSGVHTTTVWDDEVSAYKDICANIIDDINDGWDFDDPDALTVAQDIEKFVQSNQWLDAVECWNHWAISNDIGIYWGMLEEPLHTSSNAAVPGSIVWPNATAPTPLTSSPFVATTPGATCRGGCNNWNEYAYADRSDGTFICYSCKTVP